MSNKNSNFINFSSEIKLFLYHFYNNNNNNNNNNNIMMKIVPESNL